MGGYMRRGPYVNERDVYVRTDEKGSSDEVRINSSLIKGTMLLIGKGGAVRVQKGAMVLERCRFVNNTARKLGGAIFVDENRSVFSARVFFKYIIF